MRPAALLVILGLAAAARAGDGDGSQAPPPQPAPPAAPAQPEAAPEPKIEVVAKGEGRALQKGDIALAHVRLALAGNPRPLIDTRAEGDAQPLPVGLGRVIPGMDRCLEKMRVGDHWKVRIPWQLGYGEQGYESIVPPHSDLDFDVEVLGVLEVKHEVVKAGDPKGELPGPGDLLCIHYTGSLPDGTVFESTRTTDEPRFVFLGAGQLLPGWELTLQKMRVGDRWKVVIPWQLAYGIGGAKNLATGKIAVPPRTDLTYDFERLPLPEVETLEEIKKGDGTKVRPGMTVSVHYTGSFTDGKVFDSSRERNQPFEFQLGRGQVITGWELAVARMRVGDRVKVKIPWILAYGSAGSPPKIPPKSDLVFDIEVLSAK